MINGRVDATIESAHMKLSVTDDQRARARDRGTLSPSEPSVARSRHNPRAGVRSRDGSDSREL